MLVTKDFGIPLWNKPFEGNINDVTFFKNFINSLVDKIEIFAKHCKNITLVMDKGNNSPKNIEKIDKDLHFYFLGSLAPSQYKELLRIQGVEYVRFVRGLVELANVMSKKFYVVVPFYVLETPDSKRGLLENIKMAFGSSKDKVKAIQDENFPTYKAQIEQRAELIFDGLQGMGLEAHYLVAEELVPMFTALYNPKLI